MIVPSFLPAFRIRRRSLPAAGRALYADIARGETRAKARALTNDAREPLAVAKAPPLQPQAENQPVKIEKRN